MFEHTEPSWNAWVAGQNADNNVWGSEWGSYHGFEWQAMRKKATRGCGSLVKEAMCYKSADDTDGNVDCCVRKASDKVCKQWDDSKEETALW